LYYYVFIVNVLTATRRAQTSSRTGRRRFDQLWPKRWRFAWQWTAIDADTKLTISYALGNRGITLPRCPNRSALCRRNAGAKA